MLCRPRQQDSIYLEDRQPWPIYIVKDISLAGCIGRKELDNAEIRDAGPIGVLRRKE